MITQNISNKKNTPQELQPVNLTSVRPVELVPAEINNYVHNYNLQPLPSDLIGTNVGFDECGNVGFVTSEVSVSNSEYFTLQNSEFIGLEQSGSIRDAKKIRIVNNGVRKIKTTTQANSGINAINVGTELYPDLKLSLDYLTIKNNIKPIQTIIFNGSDYTPDTNGQISITSSNGSSNLNLETPKKTLNITNISVTTKSVDVKELLINGNALTIPTTGRLINLIDSDTVKVITDTTNNKNDVKFTLKSVITKILDTNGNAITPNSSGEVQIPPSQTGVIAYHGELDLTTAQNTSLYSASGLDFNSIGSSAGTKPSSIDQNDAVMFYYGTNTLSNLVPTSMITRVGSKITFNTLVSSVATTPKLSWYIVKNN